VTKHHVAFEQTTGSLARTNSLVRHFAACAPSTSLIQQAQQRHGSAPAARCRDSEVESWDVMLSYSAPAGERL
jgi:hypothetical protein